MSSRDLPKGVCKQGLKPKGCSTRLTSQYYEALAEENDLLRSILERVNLNPNPPPLPILPSPPPLPPQIPLAPCDPMKQKLTIELLLLEERVKKLEEVFN